MIGKPNLIIESFSFEFECQVDETTELIKDAQYSDESEIDVKFINPKKVIVGLQLSEALNVLNEFYNHREGIDITEQWTSKDL